MDLKIRDVSELLNVSEEKIENWIHEGMIPAYKIQDEYRFSRIEVEEWVMKNQPQKEPLMFSSGDHPSGINQFSLYRAIHLGESFSLSAHYSSKEELISCVIDKVKENLLIDTDVLKELLVAREKLSPTAINHGIAIPHSREIVLGTKSMIHAVFLEHPIDYGALDKEPVHTLFFLFASDDSSHLHLLAKIAHWTSDPSAIKLLKTCPSKEDLLQDIKRFEKAL